MQVDPELCEGCGVCVEACPNGAITLQANIAAIDRQRCTECEACVDVCPTGALAGEELLPAPVAARPEIMIEPSKPVTVSAPGRFAPLVGAGLAYLGREIGPRLVDAIINALERRLDRASTTVVTTNSASGLPAFYNQNGMRQIRRRKRQRASRRG
jgi:NAD-dependent dihydropyrimidine dehydrogenase PreA subunit